MSVDICPNCENVLKGEKPRFCDKCGFDLSRKQVEQNGAIDKNNVQPEIDSVNPQKTDSSSSQEQKEAVFLEKMKAAMRDGHLPLEDIPKLSALREELGINMERAKEMFDQAVESFRPMKQDDFDEKLPKETSHGITLFINRNLFCMETLSGVVELKLENLSDDYFDSIELEISGNLFGRAKKWCCRVKPCESVEKGFTINPAAAGFELVQFSITARQNDSIYAYWAEAKIPVFAYVSDPKDVQVQAKELINIGDNFGRAGAGDISIHIDSLIAKNKIKKVNDFIAEFAKMDPDFDLLKLQYDPNRSEQIKFSQTMVQTSGAGKRILEPETGSLTQTASLQVQRKTSPVNIVLVAKDEINLGKNRKNEIVTRICPRSVINDEKTNRISRTHCHINLTEKGVFVTDSGSANGTLFNSKKVDADGVQIKGGGKVLELAEVLSMKVNVLGDKRQLNISEYEQLIESPGDLWQKASKANLNSITLSRLENLSLNDENGTESYCLVYRIVTIGSESHASIAFDDKGLEEWHAAILYFNQRFYLENLCDLADVFVGDRTVSKAELIPLSFGDRIRIARLDIKFLQWSHLYVDT